MVSHNEKIIPSKYRKYKIGFLIIAFAYILFGIHFYFTDLRYSRMAVMVCPPLNTQVSEISIPQEPTNEGCKTQTFSLKQEIPQAILMTIFWLPMMVGKGLLSTPR